MDHGSSVVNNSLWELDPLSAMSRVAPDSGGVDNSLSQMDPLSTMSRGAPDSGGVDNSLSQMDPLSTMSRGAPDSGGVDNSLSQMDPLSTMSRGAPDSGGVDNSLWQLDPLSTLSRGAPDSGGVDNSLWQLDPLSTMSCGAPDSGGVDNSLSQMDPLSTMSRGAPDNGGVNNSLWQLDPLSTISRGAPDSGGVDNSLWQLDPLSTMSRGAPDSGGVDNSLWQMDPLSTMSRGAPDSGGVDNSLWQMDPLSTMSRGAPDSSGVDNSLSQMDPLSTMSRGASDSGGVDNSLWQLDPLSTMSRSAPDSGGVDNSLWQMDPLSTMSRGAPDSGGVDNSLWQMDPLSTMSRGAPDSGGVDNSLSQMDPLSTMSRGAPDSGGVDNSLWQMDPLSTMSRGAPDSGGVNNSLSQMDPLAHTCDSEGDTSNHLEHAGDSPLAVSGVEPDSGAGVLEHPNGLLSSSSREMETVENKVLSVTELSPQTHTDLHPIEDEDIKTVTPQVGETDDDTPQNTAYHNLGTCTSLSPTAHAESPEQTTATSESPASDSSITSLYVTACESIISPSVSVNSPSSCQTADFLEHSSTEKVKLSSQFFQAQSLDSSQNMSEDLGTMTNITMETPAPSVAMGSLVTSDDAQNSSDPVAEVLSQGEQELIAKLREEIRQKNGDLHLAGEFGSQLIVKNSQLQDQLETVMKDHSQKVEDLEQDRYSMQLRLDQRAKMEANYVEEIDSLKSALRRQTQEHEEFLEAEHNSKVSELRSQVLAQQTELEQAQMSCRQLGAEKGQLETLLQEARDQLEQKISLMNDTCSEEMGGLHAEINALQNDKIALARDLNSARNMEEQYQLRCERVQCQLVAKEQEVEERQVQATSYYNALERERESVQDLKVQLEVARMESQNMRTKGNSLFSEVEDRRVEAEKELISFKVKLDSLSKQLNMTKQNEHTLKHQLSILLRKAGHTADVEHMQRLQEQLSVARSEITTLTQQLQHRDKQPQKKTAKAEMYDAWYTQMSTEDPNRMVFFENLLKNKQRELEAVQAELKTRRMMLLAEDQKVLRYESQLYDTQRQLEKQRDANIKLKLKIDELRMKYEPERHTGGSIMKGIVEKIPSPKSKPKTGKENQPVEIKDVWPEDSKSETNKTAVKDLSKTKTTHGTQHKPSGDSKNSLPKPLSATTKPVIKSLQRKQVRIAEDVVVIKSSGDEDASTDMPSQPPELLECHRLSEVGQIKEQQMEKGQVKGQQRQRKVKVVGEEDAACAQQ